jgi:hypothetical protein
MLEYNIYTPNYNIQKTEELKDEEKAVIPDCGSEMFLAESNILYKIAAL